MGHWERTWRWWRESEEWWSVPEACEGRWSVQGDPKEGIGMQTGCADRWTASKGDSLSEEMKLGASERVFITACAVKFRSSA